MRIAELNLAAFGPFTDRVLAFGLESGKKRVEWVVLDWNTPAVEFYKSTGATMLENWNLCQMREKDIKTYLSKK